MMFNSENPLWMPNGSVRALLALSVVGTFVYMCAMTANYEAIGLLAVMIAKDYFQKKPED